MLKDAFNFMRYDWAKMLGILAGIIISVFLVGQQLGIFSTMIRSMQGLASLHPDYVWVVDAKTKSTIQLLNVDERVGRSLRSIEGVRAAHPVVIGSGSATFEGGAKIGVTLLGVKTPYFKGGPKEYPSGSNLGTLLNDGAVFLNSSDRSMMEGIDTGQHFQLNDQRVWVAGFFKGLSGFGTAYVLTTLERARKLGNMTPNKVSAYLVEVDTSAVKKDELIAFINERVPNAKALEGQRLATETIAYMLQTSNIALSFGMMVVFALIAGFTIVGLTLFSSVNDRIRDYGTIKAIGGSNSLIAKLILTQSLLYAAIGFAISYGLLFGFQKIMEGGKLEVKYTPVFIAGLVVITLFISFMGSLFALRKIVRLEPVQIFRM